MNDNDPITLKVAAADSKGQKMSKLTVVQGDDWEGIYINDKLVAQGHSIPLRNGIDIAIQHKVTEAVWRAADLEWLHDVGELPDNLADAKLDPVR